MMMNQTVTKDDHFLIQTTVGLLRSSVVCLGFNLLFSFFGLLALVIGDKFDACIHLLWSLWIVYLHVRIQFDVYIFKQFDEGLCTQQFDSLLLTLGLSKSKRTTQLSLSERCLGAIKLYRWLLFSTLIQGIVLLFL